jgi:ArsR family transcriptional regulator
VVAAIFNYFNPSGISWETPVRTIIIKGKPTKVPIFTFNLDNVPTESTDADEISEPQSISLDTVVTLWRNNNVVFLDSRPPNDFTRGHIPGSINIPTTEMDDYYFKIDSMDRNMTYIAYCDGEECNSSIELALNLSVMGFKNIYYFVGGWNKWVEANLPVEK